MSFATSGVCAADTVHYEDLLASVHEHFNLAVENHRQLFVTDATALFDLYINRLPVEQRQYHRCHACRQFVSRYGNVVTISEDGKIKPIMWGGAPGFYNDAHQAVRRKVQRANVVGVFYNRERVWGTPTAGGFEHLSVVPPAHLSIGLGTTKSAGQAMADKKEDYLILLRSLADFNATTVAQAVTLLESDALYRSEKCLGVAKWLQDLHEQLAGQTERVRRNLVWRAVAGAPAGFCHVRSSMIGTLLEDLAEGRSMSSIRRRFDQKMNPLQYQRPQAQPKAGNVVRANKIIEQLGAAGALRRRFARLGDIQKFEWQPSATPVRRGKVGVFSHLLGSEPKDRVALPKTTMTWEKFTRTVLREATKIEAQVPNHGPFLALCTAVNIDAPPIVQWDSERRRNPVTWYVYSGGSSASQWNLRGGQYVEVTGITKLPHMWHNEHTHRHHGAGIVLLLAGCRDTRDACAGMFPEFLRSDYHEIRSTIEAHSRSSKLEGRTKATACGLDLRKNGRWNVVLRVTTDKSIATIVLDRWD